tara:strand:+ start:9643 stop:10602 length:960 start_codon:yes stop_codon:yes gene_type:complete
MKNQKLISIVTPVMNEESNLDFYYQEITKVINKNKKYEFEIIFTDNASADNTYEKALSICKKDKRFKIYRFLKNHGYQKSILTGYKLTKGDAAIQMDCDLQDPPELINELITFWEKGNRIVYGVRSKRDENFFITFLRRRFYRVISKITNYDLPNDVGDFMLLDRMVLDQLINIESENLYLRGIIFSYGFKSKGIKYNRSKRKFGKSKFPMKKMFGLALDGIFNESVIPLKLAFYLGLFLGLITLGISFLLVVLKLLCGTSFPHGYVSLALLILASISINSFFLGIMGEYMSRIFRNSQNRSKVIISRNSCDELNKENS